MDCEINREKIRESLIDSILGSLEGVEITSSDSFRVLEGFNQDLIENINYDFQDEIIELQEDGTYKVNPSKELLDAYESKMQPEIQAQQAQIASGAVRVKNPRTMLRINDFLSRIGVEVQTLQEIVVNGQKLNADGVALPLQSLILNTTNDDGTVLTEEAMHIGVELLSQKNPELYQTLLAGIVNHPIYQQTFREYKDIKEYQKDGKVDTLKIKKEALGKLLSEVASQQYENKEAKSWWAKMKTFLKELFSPLKQEMNDFRAGVEAILQDDMGTVRETLLQSPEYLYEQGFTQEETDRIINLSQSMITNAELKLAIGDMLPTILYMKATPTQERKMDSILSRQSEITEDKGTFTFKGNKIPQTATTIAIQELRQNMSDTNPLYQELEDSLKEDNLIVEDVLSRVLDSDGYLSVKSLPSKGTQYDTIANMLLEKLGQFPEFTKFAKNVLVADGQAAGKIDLLAIDPSETYHIINFQDVTLQKDERINEAMVRALQAEVTALKKILGNEYKVTKFGEMRTMLINTRVESGITVTEASARSLAYDYLAPIPIRSETLGGNLLDSIYQKLYNITSRRKVTNLKDIQEVKKDQVLSGLMSSGRAIQIARTVGPLTNQIRRLTELMQETVEDYNKNIKGKNLKRSDPQANKFLKDFALYLSLGDSLKEVNKAVIEVNTRTPGIIAKYELKSLAEAHRFFTEAMERLNEDAQTHIADIMRNDFAIRDLLQPELIQQWLSRNFNSASMSTQATVKALSAISSMEKSKAEVNHNEFNKKLLKLKKSYMDWMQRNNIPTKDVLKLITQKSAHGEYIHRLINKIDRSFYDGAKVALQNKDLGWIKDNIDLRQYEEWYKQEKDTKFFIYENTTWAPEDVDLDTLIKERKDKWEERYDIKKGLDPLNRMILNFPKESKFISEEYKELEKKGNEPALELYNLIQEMNQRAVESGVLDRFVAQTFLPYANKGLIEKVIFGEGLGTKESLGRFFQRNEEYYSYRDDQQQGSEKVIPFNLVQNIAKHSLNPLTGEVTVDYSNVSTDIFSLLAAYDNQIELYNALTEIETSAQLLQNVENNKDSIATDRRSGNRIQGVPNVENLINKDALDKHINADVYGQSQDNFDVNGTIAANINKTNEYLNRKFGTNLRTDNKDIVFDVGRALNFTRSWFIYTKLGLNPATAMVNFFGTHFQAMINSGKHFSLKEFEQGYWTMMNQKITQKLTSQQRATKLGMVDFFLPLVDNETNQMGDRGMTLTRLKNFDLGHTVMTLLRESDKPVQWGVALAYLENTILQDGELVNAREYLRNSEDYVNRFNLAGSERASLNEQFEKDLKIILDKQGLEKLVEFDADGYPTIKGLERNSETVSKIRLKIQQLSKNATGMGTNNEHRLVNSNLIMRNLMTFFSWAPRLISQRFKGVQVNQDEIEQGRIRVFGNALGKMIFERGTSLIDLYNLSDRGVESLKEEFVKVVERYEAETGKSMYERDDNESLNYQKAEAEYIEMYSRSLKQQTREIAILTAAFGLLLSIIKFGPDDDDDKTGLHKYAAKTVRKIVGEIMFFYNPASIFDLTNGKVFPGATMVKDGIKAVANIRLEVFGDEEEQERAKGLGKTLKVVPILSQIGPMIAAFNQSWAEELDYRLPEATLTDQAR